MKIFISWSGEFSRSVATILKKYLPTILQGVDAFVSAHDIESGARWASTLTGELEKTNYGVLCLTPSNLDSRWLLFEAGALSKFQESSVCGLLLGGLKPTDVDSPLSQFQHRQFNKIDVRTLLLDINSKRESPLETQQLDLLFETLWPKIDEDYQKVLPSKDDKESVIAKPRDDRALLEEILFRLRQLETKRGIVSSVVTQKELLDSPVTEDTLAAYTEWKFPGKGISMHWQSALLSDIRSQKYPSLLHIDAAVNKAAPAVSKYAVEEPDVFPTGTDYITKSLGFVDNNFRREHSFSSFTMDAFKRLEHLVKKS